MVFQVPATPDHSMIQWSPPTFVEKHGKYLQTSSNWQGSCFLYQFKRDLCLLSSHKLFVQVWGSLPPAPQQLSLLGNARKSTTPCCKTQYSGLLCPRAIDEPSNRLQGFRLNKHLGSWRKSKAFPISFLLCFPCSWQNQLSESGSCCSSVAKRESSQDQETDPLVWSLLATLYCSRQ